MKQKGAEGVSTQGRKPREEGDEHPNRETGEQLALRVQRNQEELESVGDHDESKIKVQSTS